MRLKKPVFDMDIWHLYDDDGNVILVVDNIDKTVEWGHVKGWKFKKK